MSKKFHPKDQLLQELVMWFEESIQNESNAFIPEEELEQLIEYYESLPNYEKAFLVVDRGIRLFPFSGGFYMKKAQLYFQVKEYEEAWNAIEEARVYDSGSSDILLLQSDLHSAQGNYLEAINMLKELSSIVSPVERIDVWLEIADVYNMANMNKELGLMLQRVLRAMPLNEEALHRYWNHVVDNESFNLGITFFQEIIDKSPYNFLAWYYLAKCYEEIESYDKAIDSYEYSLAINSYYFAFWDFGICLQNDNNWNKAISVYQEMLELFDQDTAIYIELANCEKQKGSLEQAKAYLLSAKDNATDAVKEANCLYHLGSLYEYFGDYKQAIINYQNAISIRPRKPKFWNHLGKCYLKMNRVEDAKNCFVQSLENNDEQPKQWLKLASCYYRLESPDRLLDVMQTAQGIYPDHVKLNYYYAAYLLRLGFKQSGLVQLEHSLNLDASKKKHIFALFPELKEQTEVSQLCDQF